MSFNAKEISLVPTAFQKVVPPSEWNHLKPITYEKLPIGQDAVPDTEESALVAFPSQTSATYCQRFFVELYEQAKAVPPNTKVHPFDFTLLALLRAEEKKSIGRELASLLFYVRHFPERFPWSFSTRTPDWTRDVYNVIVEECPHLGADMHTLNQQLKAKVEFPYRKTLKVELPKKAAAPPQPLPEIESLPINPRPFASCCQDLFKKTSSPSGFGKEELFEPSLLENSPLEKEIIAKYEQGHAA